MAKIWDNLGGYQRPAILEDPRAANDGFYIDGVKHDKTSLTPAFGRMINFATNNSNIWTYRHDTQRNDTYGNQTGLHLSKMTVNVGEPNLASPNGESRDNWPATSHWQDLSFNNGVGAGGWKHGNSFVLTDGVDETAHIAWVKGSQYYEQAWPKMDSTKDLDEANPNMQSTGITNSYKNGVGNYWGKIIADGTRRFAPALSSAGVGSSSYPNTGFCTLYDDTAGEEWPFKQESIYEREPLGFSTYTHGQFIGETADGTGMIIIGNYCQSARTGANSAAFKIVKECYINNTYNPTGTALLNYAPNPVPAAGSHQGGNANGGTINFWGWTWSQQFDDPRGTANIKCMYGGYYDSYGNYAPMILNWNTTNDTFTVEHDVTLDVNSTVHSDLRNSSSTGNTGNDRMAYAVTTTWTSGGNRYLCDFKIDGRESFFDNDEDWKTWVVYKMDASTPKTLTYHSKVVMPGHARNWIWLNDSQTLLGIWFRDNFIVYSWNDTTGWNSTTTIAGPIWEVGRDSLDRIWFTKQSSTQSQRAEVHLLTPTLPVTISVTPELVSYTYSGSDIVTNLAVSALNASGARIATSVKLTIEGSSMKFSDDTTTKTVTTLTTGDLTVATKVVGAGFTNVAASIEI